MIEQEFSFTENILAWCRRFVEMIITFVNNIAGIFDLKIFEILNPFRDIPVVGDVFEQLISVGGLLNPDWTLLQLMFGAGVPLFVAFVLVKFVLDIVL